ncbi:MAG: CDP-alcohol phosphatidyltransferase family protein [bacterium]|nr:CDP-alcohol phosphatidyltransferase family protein [bacterium]
MKSPALNTATTITLLRLLSVPIFIALLIRHRQLFLATPHPHTLLLYRYAALSVFLLAAISDALDGFIARHFHQRTVLGTWLDPLADKLLLLAAVIMLSMRLGLPFQFPFWFPIIVISRDAILLFGTLVVFMLRGHVAVRPTLAGKLTTTAQMAVMIATLAALPQTFTFPLVLIASLFTLLSGAQYVLHGLRQLSDLKPPLT